MAIPLTPYGTDQISRLHWDGKTLTVVQQRTRPVMAQDWSAADEAGHAHAYGSPDNPFPTLTRVSDEPAETSENPDDDSEIERYHLACAQCGEKMWPSPSGPGAELLPGTFFYWIDDEPATERDARHFTDLIRAGDYDRWLRLRGWLKYSAGLIPRTNRVIRD